MISITPAPPSHGGSSPDPGLVKLQHASASGVPRKPREGQPALAAIGAGEKRQEMVFIRAGRYTRLHAGR